jgi:hypothetical protein
MLRYLLTLNNGRIQPVEVYLCPLHAAWVSEELRTMVTGAVDLADRVDELCAEIQRNSLEGEAAESSDGQEQRQRPLSSPEVRQGEHTAGNAAVVYADDATRTLDRLLLALEDRGRLSVSESNQIRWLAHQVNDAFDGEETVVSENGQPRFVEFSRRPGTAQEDRQSREGEGERYWE